MNVTVHVLDEEGRYGIGNERQDPVCLRFSLYQGANLPVLSGASYRGRVERRRTHRQASCQSQKPCCPALQKFSVSLMSISNLIDLKDSWIAMTGVSIETEFADPSEVFGRGFVSYRRSNVLSLPPHGPYTVSIPRIRR